MAPPTWLVVVVAGQALNAAGGAARTRTARTAARSGAASTARAQCRGACSPASAGPKPVRLVVRPRSSGPACVEHQVDVALEHAVDAACGCSGARGAPPSVVAADQRVQHASCPPGCAENQNSISARGTTRSPAGCRAGGVRPLASAARTAGGGRRQRRVAPIRSSQAVQRLVSSGSSRCRLQRRATKSARSLACTAGSSRSSARSPAAPAHSSRPCRKVPGPVRRAGTRAGCRVCQQRNLGGRRRPGFRRRCRRPRCLTLRELLAPLQSAQEAYSAVTLSCIFVESARREGHLPARCLARVACGRGRMAGASTRPASR